MASILSCSGPCLTHPQRLLCVSLALISEMKIKQTENALEQFCQLLIFPFVSDIAIGLGALLPCRPVHNSPCPLPTGTTRLARQAAAVGWKSKSLAGNKSSETFCCFPPAPWGLVLAEG